jgi:esterase/lipase superfamily enzyme
MPRRPGAPALQQQGRLFMSIRLRWLCVCFAAALSVAGCAGRPPGGLVPVAAPAEVTARVPILAVSLRRPSDDAGLLFDGRRTLTPRFAALTISLPPGHKTGEVAWPSSAQPDPTASFAATQVELLDERAFAAALRQRTAGPQKRHVLVFVHGYNTRFDEAAFRFAQIVHDAGAPVTPVLFSWASWGGITAYPYDRESAAIGRDALEALLARLARDPGVGEISVLAHSMGGWLAMEALRQMAIRQGRVPSKITDLMLASPDIDVDVAMAQGRVVTQGSSAPNRTERGAIRPRVTLFISRDDRALGLARLIWGSRDRLGSIDPDSEPYRTNLARAGVEVVDLTDEASRDRLAHGKFAESPRAVQLIGQRLAAGQSVGGAQQDIATGAGLVTQGAISAVGRIITAPLGGLAEQPAPGVDTGVSPPARP